jgi:hypothetical protein
VGKPTLLKATIAEKKAKLLNGHRNASSKLCHQLVHCLTRPNGTADRILTQPIDFDHYEAAILNGSNQNLDTPNSISVRNLSFDGISRTGRNRNKLPDFAIQLRNTIEPQLAFVGGVDNSIVLDRLLLIDQASTAKGSGKGFDDGFT